MIKGAHDNAILKLLWRAGNRLSTVLGVTVLGVTVLRVTVLGVIIVAGGQ